MSMKCLIKDSEEEGYKLVEHPIPVPGPNEVLIRVEKVSFHATGCFICSCLIQSRCWNGVNLLGAPALSFFLP